MGRISTCCIVGFSLLCTAVAVSGAKTCAPPTVGYKINMRPAPKHGVYTPGKTLTFSCPLGYSPPTKLPTATLCQANGTWTVNFTASPVSCKAASCPLFTANQLIPFGKIQQTTEGDKKDPSYAEKDWYHILGAVLTYVCDKGASIVGSAASTCQANGTWSGNSPYCQVVATSCTKCPAQQPACCDLNGNAIGCCTNPTMQTLAARFDQVPKACAAQLATELMPCGGRLLQCLDFPHAQTNPDNCIQPMPTFGCYHNQHLPGLLGKDLDDACAMYSETSDTMSCVASTTLTMTGSQYLQGFCLPKSCQDKASLTKLVASTIELDCDNDLLVSKLGYCLASGLNITCANGLSSSLTPPYPATCSAGGKCASAAYPKWTECCSLDSTQIGCCSPLAQKVLTSRFSTLPAKSTCTSAMKSLLSPCLSQMVQCLSNITGSSNANCPNLHGCSVPLQTKATCDVMMGGTGSVYCTKTCSGQANCLNESFCMPSGCASNAALTQIATGDAQISCNLLKASSSAVQFCNWVNVSISCDGGLTGSFAFDDRIKNCSAPPAAANGFFNVTYPSSSTLKGKYPSGTTVAYHCNTGYAPANSKTTITCQNGQWSPSAPAACALVSCGKPVVDTKTGSQVLVHGKYSYNGVADFSCHDPGYTAIPPSSKCQANGKWDFKEAPYCVAVTCPAYQKDELIPFGKIELTSMGANDPRYSDADRYHVLNAVVTFECDAGDTGNATRTCQADGTWSGDVPYCEVATSTCSAASCSKSNTTQTSCCSMGSQSVGCCSQAVMQTMAARFDGLTGQCAKDLQQELLPCSGRILQCMEFPDKQKNALNCNPAPMYGCYRNKILPSTLGPALTGNCSAYSATKTVPCVSETTVTLTGTIYPQGFCLPESCADQIGKIASSSIELDCDDDLLVKNGGFCQGSSLKITCSNHLNTTYTPLYPAECSVKGECPVSKFYYSKWTECCSSLGDGIGCCSPLAKKLMDQRYSSFAPKSQCAAAMKTLLSPCLPQLVQCLSNITTVGQDSKCPSLHGCSVPYQTNATCDLFAGKDSVFCTRTCAGIPNCKETSFCLPKGCASADALNQIAISDAMLSCSLWKTSGPSYCDFVNVTIDCEDGNQTLSGSASLDDRAKYCKEPMIPQHGHLNVTRPPGSNANFTYPIGAVVTYTCAYGYAPTALFTKITCEPDGTWNHVGSDCTLISCGTPLIDHSSGVHFRHKNFSYGDTVVFNCSEEGFNAIPASSFCNAQGSWDYTNVPYCTAANCPVLYSLYGEDNDRHDMPYGRVMLEKTGVNDSLQVGESDHLYGAVVKFFCDPPRTPTGPSTLTCQDDGEWSSMPPLCTGAQVACNTTGDCANVAGHPTFTECCSFGLQESGPTCCPATTKSVLSARFAGLEGQCLSDMTDAYRQCSGQVVDCFNSHDGSCSLEVERFYRYGCNSGVPIPVTPIFSDELNQFCSNYGPNNSVACLETLVDVTGSATSGNTACIPHSCLDEVNLHAIALSSLDTYCAVNNDAFYCSYKRLTLQCQTGVNVEAARTATCDECPPKDQPTLTECCEVENYTLGCCSKGVKNAVQDRFVNASRGCMEGLAQQLQICGEAVVSCLNHVELTSTMHACPNLHNCHSWLDYETCTSDSNITAECLSNCTGVNACVNDHYCLPAECMNEADVAAITVQDTLLACDVYKFASGNTTCGDVTVNTQCYGSDGYNISSAHTLRDEGHINVTLCNDPFIPANGYVKPNASAYRSGTTLEYFCDQYYRFAAQDKYADYSANITCMPFGGWNAHAPDCVPVNCPDILGELIGGEIPFGSISLKRGGVGANSTACVAASGSAPCAHTGSAVLQYSCNKGTSLIGPSTRTCLQNGTWTGVPPFCDIPQTVCRKNSKDCTGDTPVCITIGTDAVSGPMCGTAKTQQLIDLRFGGLSSACQYDLLQTFAQCATQIISCLNDMGKTDCITLISHFYLYGCNSGSPPPLDTGESGKLHRFCADNGPADALSCVGRSRNIDLSMNQPESFCLPRSCAQDLDSVANSTRALECAAFDKSFVCQLDQVTLKCESASMSHNKTVGSAEPSGSCAKCPQPGQGNSLTQCCSLEGVDFGCCNPSVSDLLTARFAGLSKKCRKAIALTFRPCQVALIDCLNGGKFLSSSPLNNCPSLHGCAARQTTSGSDCQGFTGDNSAYCMSSYTTSILTGSSNQFCLPQECTNVADVRAYAQSEADVACVLAKQATKQQYCLSSSSNLTCRALAAPHTVFDYHTSYSDVTPTSAPKQKSKTGVVVGGVLGAILALALTVILYLYYRRRYSRKRNNFTPLKNLQDDEDYEEE